MDLAKFDLSAGTWKSAYPWPENRVVVSKKSSRLSRTYRVKTMTFKALEGVRINIRYMIDL